MQEDEVVEPVAHGRLLSDADIQALADELEDRLVRRFYLNLGRGLWGVLWRLAVTALLGLAAYGAVHGGGK
jgi:hypothetical protein